MVGSSMLTLERVDILEKIFLGMNVTALRQAVKRFTDSKESHTACLDEMEMNGSVIGRDANTGNTVENASHLVDYTHRDERAPIRSK